MEVSAGPPGLNCGFTETLLIIWACPDSRTEPAIPSPTFSSIFSARSVPKAATILSVSPSLSMSMTDPLSASTTCFASSRMNEQTCSRSRATFRKSNFSLLSFEYSALSLLVRALMASRILNARVGSRLILAKNFFLSTVSRWVSPSAVAVAERGSLSKRAISPKISPSSSVAI